jgi:hypothetical protein
MSSYVSEKDLKQLSSNEIKKGNVPF